MVSASCLLIRHSLLARSLQTYSFTKNVEQAIKITNDVIFYHTRLFSKNSK